MKSSLRWSNPVAACLKVAALAQTPITAPKKKLFKGTGSSVVDGLNANKVDPTIRRQMVQEDQEDGGVVA